MRATRGRTFSAAPPLFCSHSRVTAPTSPTSARPVAAVPRRRRLNDSESAGCSLPWPALLWWAPALPQPDIWRRRGRAVPTLRRVQRGRRTSPCNPTGARRQARPWFGRLQVQAAANGARSACGAWDLPPRTPLLTSPAGVMSTVRLLWRSSPLRATAGVSHAPSQECGVRRHLTTTMTLPAATSRGRW